MHVQTMTAIVRRDFLSYFVSLKGYVFVVAFVVLSVLAAFVSDQSAFFSNNQATLAFLHTWMPALLVFFVPAITMTAWAQERSRGTDQLLLTLPAHDHEIVIAKFLACLGVYAVALLFTLSNVGVLAYLGSPDMGLIFANYVGYLLLGSASIALALFGSSLTQGLTTSWLVGALFVALPFLPSLVPVATDLTTNESLIGQLGAVWNEMSALRRFESSTNGVVALADVLYFLTLTVGGLYANAYVLGKRHWTIDKAAPAHGGIRLACVGVSAMCLVLLAEGAAVRADISAERMLSVRPEAQAVIQRLFNKGEDDKLAVPPVLVQAWLSPDVPEDYQDVRDGLEKMLREFDARGGDQIKVAIYETELYSEEAQRAEKAFGIKPRRVAVRRRSAQTSDEIFLGLVFTCGPREVKIPFFDRGLPIQYELTRAIGTVAQFERNKVGVLKSGVDLFGGFDFQTMQSKQDWQLLEDLRKQYDVQKVEGTAAISTEIDVLVVPLPSSLPQEEMDRVLDYLYAGGRALFLCDPFPNFSLDLAPLRPAGGSKNPFQQQRRPPSKPKGNVESFMAALGLRWHKDRIVWDAYNPHREWTEIPQEFVFVAPADPADKEAASGFADHPITSGLQELLLLHGGELAESGDDQIKVTPLLQTRTLAGYHTWGDMVQETFMGVQPADPRNLSYVSKGERRAMAVTLEGKLAARADQGEVKKGARSPDEFKAVVVADMDVASDFLYNLRRQGRSDVDLELDNVTFVANAIDWLAGDDTYIALRKLRPRHRTLELIETVVKAAEAEQSKVAEEAKEDAKKKLEEAQKRLDEVVEGIEKRENLDRLTKEQLVYAAREREQRRLDAQKERIEDEKASKIRLSQTEALAKTRRVQTATLWSAIGWAVVPVLLLGCLVLWRKASLEGTTMDPARRRTS